MRRRARSQQQMLVIAGGVLLVVVGTAAFFSLQNTAHPVVITNISPSTVEVPFTTLTQGRQSTVAKRVNYVLTSPKQLSELWKVVQASGTPPRVDFKKQSVIAVFAGNESSSSIAIARIQDATSRVVSIAITKPDCTTPPSDASPYEIVAVPTTSLPLTHTDIATTISCQR